MKRLLVGLVVMALVLSSALFAGAENEGEKPAQCTAEARDGSFGCWVKCGEGKVAECDAGDDYSRSNCTCHDDPDRDDDR